MDGMWPELDRGTQVVVRELFPNGDEYAWWMMWVETMTPTHLVLRTEPEESFHFPDRDEPFAFIWRLHMRIGVPYFVAELYKPSGERHMLSADLTGNIRWTESSVTFCDYWFYAERNPNAREPVIPPASEEGFVQAARTYGYMPEFQLACRQNLQRAVDELRTWEWTDLRDGE